MIKKITGIIPALVTPFDKYGNLEKKSAEKLLEKYVDERADGLYMLGYTGEGRVMTLSERKEWTELVLSINNGRIPVIVHVGYSNEEEALDLTRHATEAGAFGVSSVPLSNSATLQENALYFKSLAEASHLPFYIYWNQEIIDKETGRRATAVKLVEAMSQVTNFAGIKYTDSNFYYLERIRKYMPELNLLTGVDTMVNAGALLGADGAIGALQSVTCGHMRIMWDAYQAGNLEKAHELQIKANHLYEMLDRPDVGVIPGIKVIMEHEGIPGLPKLPTPPLTDPSIVKQLLEVYETNIVNKVGVIK
jgi:dihydrodipicolinate synthase/N-acetylneuraminate lyase